jgi:hypothetical protein
MALLVHTDSTMTSDYKSAVIAKDTIVAFDNDCGTICLAQVNAPDVV